MADEQGSTLAFLQNFYTDVTLYMPFEAAERPPAAVLAAEPTAAPATAPVVAPPTPPVPPALVVAPPRPAILGKLPSLAGTGPAPAGGAAPVPAPTPAQAAPAAANEVPGYLLTTFATLGTNAQGVVVLVRLPAEQFAKLPRNVFLNNLLKAIGLVMADIVLVNVEGPYPVALQNLRKEIAATRVLAFGKNLLDVAIRTTQIYEPVQFPNQGLDYLAGAEVEMIEYDVSLKKRLWAGLKAMFR